MFCKIVENCDEQEGEKVCDRFEKEISLGIVLLILFELRNTAMLTMLVRMAKGTTYNLESV